MYVSQISKLIYYIKKYDILKVQNDRIDTRKDHLLPVLAKKKIRSLQIRNKLLIYKWQLYH